MKIVLTRFLLILVVITLIFPTSCWARKNVEFNNNPVMIIGKQKVKLEIADTEAKRKFGLMERRHLPENQGMLFVFEEPLRPAFWMKDCYISLDIIFIKDSKIVNLYTSVPPCEETPCPIYPSIELVDSALEVNAGFVKKHNVKINDTVTLKGLRLK